MKEYIEMLGKIKNKEDFKKFIEIYASDITD